MKLLKKLNGREDRIRTCDPLVPNQVLYQAELLPVQNGAEDRNRTGTVVTYRRILSPVRLPVPPPRQMVSYAGFEPATL